MPWIEIVLYVLLVINVLVLIINPFKKKMVLHYLTVAAFAIMLTQLMYETVRWQLYPVYFVVSMLFMASLLELRAEKSASKRPMADNRKKRIVLLMIALIISGAANYAFPVYEIKEPSGKYAIGTSTFELTDQARVETYGDDKGEKRRIKVQFWYPAEATKGFIRVRWLQDGLPVARALAKEMQLPFFLLDHTAKVMSHAYLNAPVSQDLEQYPVIVISHGWTGFRNLHTDFAEQLASNGYIVIAIDHTYGAQVVVFDDEDIALLDRGALPERETTTEFLEYANRLVSTYAGDVSFVINHLSDFNEGRFSALFTDKLNLENIGVLGHSTGGGADVMATLQGAPIKALIGLDAWVEPIEETLMEKGLNIPTLFLRSEQWSQGVNNVHLLELVESNAKSNGLIQIKGSTHIDFTMAHMYSRLTEFVGFTGSIDQDRLTEIEYTLILKFFDATMKDKSALALEPLLEKWSELERVQ